VAVIYGLPDLKRSSNSINHYCRINHSWRFSPGSGIES